MQVSRIRYAIGLFRHSSRWAPSNLKRVPLPPKPAPPIPGLFDSVASLSQKNFDEYVDPLYQYLWNVYTEMPSIVLAGDTLERRTRTVSVLGKKFRFFNRTGAIEFMSDVAEIAVEEKHEPRITVFLGAQSQHVLVRSYTQRTLSLSEDSTFIKPDDVAPGLSGYDLRLALGTELLFHSSIEAGDAFPLPAISSAHHPPTAQAIQSTLKRSRSRSAEDRLDDAWEPCATQLGTLPRLSLGRVHNGPCTDEDMANYMQPLYLRGWRAAFVPILNRMQQFHPTLCLTGFFRFTTLAAAVSFVQAANLARKSKDLVDLHFLVECRTVQAQLIFPSTQTALSMRDIARAWALQRIFDTEFFEVACVSDVHPFRDGGRHQPRTVQALHDTRRPLRGFHARQNSRNVAR